MSGARRRRRSGRTRARPLDPAGPAWHEFCYAAISLGPFTNVRSPAVNPLLTSRDPGGFCREPLRVDASRRSAIVFGHAQRVIAFNLPLEARSRGVRTAAAGQPRLTSACGAVRGGGWWLAWTMGRTALAGHLRLGCFERVFPTRGPAVPQVEGRELAVENGLIHMRTTAGSPPRW